MPHHCREDINILIVMRAMGCESDQEILALIGEEPPLAALLLQTIQVGSHYILK